MGVKELWNILSPLSERKPLFELQGKTIAIDLSCWIVDSLTVTDNAVQPKMYLRNLYFRTAYLLMQGISPVFVLEGKAPMLKHNTIAKRNDIRNGPRARKRTAKKGGRSQFNWIIKECKQMLEYMGLACVQGHGEAEAMCAYLNEDGLVHGCISQDSDCFLYGAKIVYRNFCTSAQGNRAAVGGSVDEYNIEKIETMLSLGRNKMIALALLCGCDYTEGLNGVGKEAALKLFKIIKNDNVLERIKSWKTDNSLEKKEAELLCSNLCSSCGHSGKVQKHARTGCIDCGTTVKCDDSFKEKRALILNEVGLRKKALLVEDFPNQELINEFLVRKDTVPTKLELQWKQPKICELIEFMEKRVCWEPQYAFEKIFPLVTRWQVQHLPSLSIKDRLLVPNLFVPESIKKIRNIRSVASYEVIWKNDHDIIERLKEYITLNEDEDTNMESLSTLSSIEPQEPVLQCYPELVNEFENARNLKTKKRPLKGRTRNVNCDNTETNKVEKRRQRKGGKCALNKENNRKIDEFVEKNTASSLEESFRSLSITPKRSKKTDNQHENQENINVKRGPQFDKVLQIEKVNTKLNDTLDRMFNELSPDDFLSDADDHDLNMTEVVDQICSQTIFQFNGTSDVKRLLEKNNTNPTSVEDLNTVDRITCTEAEANKSVNCIEVCDESDDEFTNISETYVPLNRRILTCIENKIP